MQINTFIIINVRVCVPEDAGSHLGERPSEKIFSSRRRVRRVNHEILWCPGDEPAGKLQLIIPDTFSFLGNCILYAREYADPRAGAIAKIFSFLREEKNSASVRALEKARQKRERAQPFN